jgi:hypothetical protein
MDSSPFVSRFRASKALKIKTRRSDNLLNGLANPA